MYKNAIIAILCLLLFCSCDEKAKEQKTVVKQADVQIEKTVEDAKNKILATVNGSAITDADLELSINKLVGEEVSATMAEGTRRKILESLVMSRAISQARMKEMNKTELAKLSRELEVYKEQLLVRQYLSNHSSPQPISMESMKIYYDNHRELFGERNIKAYEMITTMRPLHENERDELIASLSDAKKRTDWQRWTKELSANGYPIIFRQGKDDEKVLDLNLAKTIAALTSGQQSPLLFVKDRPYLIRVTSEQKIPAQPLAQVSGSIRKTLAPQQVKKAVELIGREALANAKVEYK